MGASALGIAAAPLTPSPITIKIVGMNTGMSPNPASVKVGQKIFWQDIDYVTFASTELVAEISDSAASAPERQCVVSGWRRLSVS